MKSKFFFAALFLYSYTSFIVQASEVSIENNKKSYADIVFTKIKSEENAIVAPIAYQSKGRVAFLGYGDDNLLDIIKTIGRSNFYWAVAGDLNGDGEDDLYINQRNLYAEAQKLGHDPVTDDAEKIVVNALPTLILSHPDGYKIDKTFDKLGVQCQEEQVVFADFDNDMDLDIFVPCYTHTGKTRNYLLKNDGQARFEDVSIGSGIEMYNQSKDFRVEGAQAFDYNHDGLMDFYVASKVFINLGNFKFQEKSKEIGITPNFDEGVKVLDYNNDAILDLVIFKPYKGPLFYQGTANGMFKVDEKAMPKLPNDNPKSNGYDLDGDGYFDFGYVGLSSLDFNTDGKADFISGKYDARRSKGGQTTPILMGEEGELQYFFPDWADDVSPNHIVRGPSVADIDNDGSLEMSRSAILYPEHGGDDIFDVQIYKNNASPQNFIVLNLLSPEGKRVMQGYDLTIKSSDGKFIKKVLVDCQSGFLNSNDYRIIRYVPDDIKTVQVSYVFKGQAYEFNMPVGMIAEIRAGSEPEIKKY